METRVSLLRNLQKLDRNDPVMELVVDIMHVFMGMDDYWEWLSYLDYDDRKFVLQCEDICRYNDFTNDGLEPTQEELEALAEGDPYFTWLLKNSDRD